MKHFTTFDGIDLAYVDVGAGPAAVLLHGFAADHARNWVTPGILAALSESGRRVLAADARGHGESATPHDVRSYSNGALTKDVVALFDHVGLDSVDVVGYSMGSYTAGHLALTTPRVRTIVLGGVGDHSTRPRFENRRITEAFTADDADSITDPVARAFRRFADRTGADRIALHALAVAQTGDLVDFGAIRVPTLVLAGADDVLAGSAQGLAVMIPGASSRTVPGNHLSALVEPEFAEAIAAFINAPL